MTRRLPLLGALLALFLLIPLARPAVTFAGTCPTSESVLEKSVYRVGERLDFFGSYTDFADPGTVTISFVRPADGATRTVKAQNVADGSWFSTVIFTSRNHVGAWRVQVVVDQASGISTCDDRFTLVASSGPLPTLPDSSTVAAVATDAPATQNGGLVVLGLLAVAVAVAVARAVTSRSIARGSPAASRRPG